MFYSNNSLDKFSFNYGGKPFHESNCEKTEEVKANKIIKTYKFSDGLVVKNEITIHDDFEGIEWVNYFENTGKNPTKIISKLYDADYVLPFPKDEPYYFSPYLPDFEKSLQLYAPNGSECEANEFVSGYDEIFLYKYNNLLLPNEEKSYSTTGGRSSQSRAPFFELHRQNEGYVIGVGWTGQWKTSFKRTDSGVEIKSGIENTNFYIKPGESFRTSSILIMKYQGSQVDGSNKWRRFVKKYYSLIGKEGRDSVPPMNFSFWGGISTDLVLKGIDSINKAKIPFDYIWMDAAWYGEDKSDCESAFCPNWNFSTGDWRINTFRHPDKLQKIKKYIDENKLKFLLWFEPERACENTPIVKEHPEYFLRLEENNPFHYLLLNLGNKDAWNYIVNVLIEKIEELNISCYRQDFNIDPLEFFNKNDAEDRRGITEILHINGLYKMWDTLLERFPHLLIDNCASGGRRIDIETLRRSFPLSRSDVQCSANFPPKISQMHAVQYGTWIPYSGTVAGRSLDPYVFRSGYAPALSMKTFFSNSDDFIFNKDNLSKIKKLFSDFKQIRPYLSCDMYPLTRTSYNDDVWCAIQYNRPEENDGVILIYTRDDACYTSAKYKLSGLDENGAYIFTDFDTKESCEKSGKDLIEKGFEISIVEKHVAKIILYKKK